MPAELAKPEQPSGRVVTPATLSASPSILGLPLASPWRRLVAMIVDLSAVGLLSLLSGPWLGLATGGMLIVLFGNSREAPLALKAVRMVCRVLGAIVVLLSVLALGHVSLLRKSGQGIAGDVDRAVRANPDAGADIIAGTDFAVVVAAAQVGAV
jgi:hypothetical protein